MNQISRHISYLLLTCRKVEIPGLGILTAHYEPASFDPSDKVFYPSHLRISFSSKQQIESGMLKTSLKRQMNIKDGEAKEMIEEYVEDIRHKLRKNHYVRLEGIGYLMENGDKNVVLKDTFWKRCKFSSVSAVSV